MRLTVCTPTYSGDLHYSTVGTLLHLQAWTAKAGHHFSHLVFRSPWVAYARDMLAAQALEGGATHVLMLDADLGVTDPEFVDRLLALDVDIAGALYYSKPVAGDGSNGQCMPPAFSSARAPEDASNATPLRAPVPARIDRVWVGGGCMLVRADVFRRLPQPWFAFREYVEGGQRRMVSEDWYFCEQAIRAGLTTAVDTTIATEHFGPCGWRHGRV